MDPDIQRYHLLRGTVLMIGVVADHDSPVAQLILEDLTGWLHAHPSFPLLVKHLAHDCLVAPKERGNKHVEIMWIEL